MDKVYERIIFENDKEPALDAPTLNAMSKAIDDLDNRVKDFVPADDYMELARQTMEYAEKAKEYAESAEAIVGIGIATHEKAGIIKPSEEFNIEADGYLTHNYTTDDIVRDNQDRIYVESRTTGDVYDIQVNKSFYEEDGTDNPVGRHHIETLSQKIAEDNYENLSRIFYQIENVEFGLNNIIKFREFEKGTLDGVLVANGPKFELEEGAMYLILASTYLNTTGAFRGIQAYAVSSAWGVGLTTTANAVARVMNLGATGTIGMNISTSAVTKIADGSNEIISTIGIGSCTTACRVRYQMFKVMGSVSDFPPL